MHSLFVSYATADGQDLACAVADMLKRDFLIDAYVAQRDSTAESLDGMLKNAINQSEYFLVLFTPEALKSQWVLGEVEFARSKGKKTILCRRHDVNQTDLPIAALPLKAVVFEAEADLLSQLKKQDWGIPVVIPAAGKGSGLYPFSLGMPKTLFPVREKPILHHIVEKLDPTVFSGAVVIGGLFSRMIEYQINLLNLELPVEIVPDKGDTLPMALRNLALKSTFMVHFSDIIVEGDVNWRAFINHHQTNRQQHKVIGTLMTSTQHRLVVGRVTASNAVPQLVKRFEEKPTETMGYAINMAVALFEPEFLDLVEDTDVSLFGDTVTRAIEQGHKFAFYGHEEWTHIQTLNDWYVLQEDYFGNTTLEQKRAAGTPCDPVD